MYPNPATEITHLKIDLNKAYTLSALITDINGRVVQQTQPVLYSKGTARIDLPLKDFAAGNYFVLLRDDAGNLLWTGKLLHQ